MNDTEEVLRLPLVLFVNYVPPTFAISVADVFYFGVSFRPSWRGAFPLGRHSKWDGANDLPMLAAVMAEVRNGVIIVGVLVVS